tara:strand:- start:12012 stop:14006 length:1995 start_codon:yes stop_codon:yes gene_type:complete
MADLVLGIDAGGTFTDALLYCKEENSVLARAKTPTTHDNLSLCLAAALETVMGKVAVAPSQISVVSVSTTLATNALVEDGGRAAGLVTIGFKEDALSRAGLSRISERSPHLKLAGGHSSHGSALQDLDLRPLDEWLTEHDSRLEAYAVAGSFSVRNPEHEQLAGSFIQSRTGKPVTVSHELSSNLNAPKRATTALLNARLVPIVNELVTGVEGSMLRAGLTSRLMVMRGDGSLVSSDFVRDRPIETILSGPAASAIGAAALAGIDDGVVVDIGGTTTDVVIINEGRPVAAPSGAVVGGHETMVSAVRAHTFGIGGDSRIQHNPLSDDDFTIGPSRATPLVVAAIERPSILSALSQQLERGRAQETDGVFLWLREIAGSDRGASRAERDVLAELANFSEGASLESVARTQLAHNAINRLISSGAVGVSAFTPTDAAHILEIDNRYSVDAAVVGGILLARQLDRFGVPLAVSEADMAGLVIQRVRERTAEAVLIAAADHDALSATELSLVLKAQRSRVSATDRSPLLRMELGVAASVALVGAPAHCLGPANTEEWRIHSAIPDHFEIANAFGSAIGDIRLAHQITVSAPRRGLYRVHIDEPITFYDLKAAQQFAEEKAEAHLRNEMRFAGGQSCNITHNWDLEQAIVEERELFVEATLKSRALGSP